MLEAQISLIQLLPRRAQGFRTVTGVGELSRQELQLKQEVVRRGAAAESERVRRGAETPADIFSC